MVNLNLHLAQSLRSCQHFQVYHHQLLLSQMCNLDLVFVSSRDVQVYFQDSFQYDATKCELKTFVRFVLVQSMLETQLRF